MYQTVVTSCSQLKMYQRFREASCFQRHLPRLWRRQIPLKSGHISARLRGFTSQKALHIIDTAGRTSYVTSLTIYFSYSCFTSKCPHFLALLQLHLCLK